MVIDQRYHEETVFDVFATRARRRSRKSLRDQAAACGVACALLPLLDVSWWPLAAGLAAGALYAAWGLLDRHAPSPLIASALQALAAIAFIFAITAVIGVGLAAFTGDGRSPYGTCYDENGRAFACDARGQRRS
jgi:hypothetical protein